MNTAPIRSAYVLDTASSTIWPNVATSPWAAGSTTLLLMASRPAPTPTATNIIARKSSPLPMNTVEKNLSSKLPKPSRTTPMNHRKAIPANGMIFAAILMFLLPASNHCEPGSAPSGSARRIKIKHVPNSSANNTPAIAAARGVVSGCGFGVRHGWPGISRIISPLASASRLLVRVMQLGVDERLAALRSCRPSHAPSAGVSIGVTFR